MDYDAIIKYPTYEEGFALWIRIGAKKKGLFRLENMAVHMEYL